MPYNLSDFDDIAIPAPDHNDVGLSDLAGGVSYLEELPADLRRKLSTPPRKDENRSDVDDGIMRDLLRRYSPADARATFLKSERGLDAVERKRNHWSDYIDRTVRHALSVVKKGDKVKKESEDDDGFFEVIESAETQEEGLALVKGRDVVHINPEYVSKPYIVKNSLNLFVGDPGSGKSLEILDMLAKISRGQSIFGGKALPAADVMFLSNEDPNGISKARFVTAGGNIDRICFEAFDGGTFALSEINKLRVTIRRKKPAVVVIDSIMSHVGGKVDIYRANEVAAILIPLVAIAEELRVTIIGVMHLNKQDAANILYRVQASVAFVGSARSVIAFAPDPDLNKTESRILCHIKANYSEKGPCQEIHITDKKGIGHAEWQGESDLKATDVFGKPRSASEGKKIREAEDFIMEMMIDGEMPSNEIFDEADSRKISERTLNRAKKNLRIEAGRSKDGSRGIWKWPKKTARDLAKEKK